MTNEKDDGDGQNDERNDKKKVRVVLVHERDDDTAKDCSNGQDAERNGHCVQKCLLLLGGLSVQGAFHDWLFVLFFLQKNGKKDEVRKKKKRHVQSLT